MKRWIGVLGAWWNVRVMLPIEEVEALCFIPDLGCRPGPRDMGRGDVQ
ncbi:hypothetical protein [Cognatazoarcus halotolerans]|nr:hypothetical protein [Cognatazoarcus halotolerans]MBX3679128.1 hypothetical protein [Rhodocyclaceae bacterium]MCB1898078.1 hypothetical protein [Rhodocyclaceae bacterium]MCP5309230.1 hypothetical protein [Zoogloeaceae bacterium]